MGLIEVPKMSEILIRRIHDTTWNICLSLGKGDSCACIKNSGYFT